MLKFRFSFLFLKFFIYICTVKTNDYYKIKKDIR